MTQYTLHPSHIPVVRPKSIFPERQTLSKVRFCPLDLPDRRAIDDAVEVLIGR